MKAEASSSVKHTVPAVIKAMDLVRLLAEERGETTTKALAFGSSGAALLSGLITAEAKAILDRAPEACWALQRQEDVLARIRALRDAARQAEGRLREAGGGGGAR